MGSKVRRIAMFMAALFLVSSAWAAVEVVDVDGTSYSVGVVNASGSSCSSETALSYLVTRPGMSPQSGVVSPTQDTSTDTDPRLVLVPGSTGPILIWSRHDGNYHQVAYSRFEGDGWTDFRYLTSGPRNHTRPEAAIDSQGRGTLVWTEDVGPGRVMVATFDPATGNLILSERDLLRELVRHSPAEWLSAQRDAPRKVGGRPAIPGIEPEGGSEVPSIPPGSSTKKVEPPSGDVTAEPVCSKAVAAVIRQRALWIGVLEAGVVVRYYRSVVPEGAADSYVDLLLWSLLQQNCQ